MKSRELFDYSVKIGMIPMKIEDVDTSKRTIMGVGNAYNFLDSQLDVLQNGAAKRSIDMMGPQSESIAKIQHAKDHDLTKIPGKITKLEEREVNIKGENVMCLCFESKLSDTQLGNELLAQYLDGTYTQHSIGFKYMKHKFYNPMAHGNSVEGKEWNEFKGSIINLDEYEELAASIPDYMGPEAKQVLKVDEIKLFEISTVALGANKLTPYLGNKAGNPETLILMLNNRLKKLQDTLMQWTGDKKDSVMFTIKCQISQLQALHQEIFNDIDMKTALAGRPTEQAKNIDFSEKVQGLKL